MLNIIQLGLGPIGQQLTRYLVERKGISIVGAVDPDPQKVGNDVGLFAGIEELGIRISPNLESCEATDSADLAVISTVSSLQKMESQIKEAADYDLDVVSTCEELSHPWQTQPELAQSIDNYCKQKEIACVGTGVNPGFLMDYLPSVLTSVCRNVEHIKVERIQNAEPRRKPFRDKIGVGLTESEFKEKEHSIRHVGLKESVYMIADGMNWTLDNVEETLVPVKADKAIQNGKINVSEEQIAGVEQVARGYIDGNEVIVLVFKAAVGIQEPHDTVTISGVPDFKSTIPGGINGDIATSAIIVNAIRTICHASPGLKTMLDIQVPAYFSNI
ncbi:hypothetical protein [Fodinibius sp.]|uniref:NAD(P)H-dependent amine dehydrogenase family protein n=1 Tax=Fodinibius sp. TaxID=1872440 RepID=UPI002ACDECCD|nr:hypothetical protein [Fodinibius sp.]MDZ7658625.1 hypothetical protein [Fodinibius sp.]